MHGYFGQKSFSISPMDVKFAQDSIAYSFRGREYGDVNPTGEKIARGEIPIDFFLPIEVIHKNRGYFSLDNRRLYIFRILNLLDILDTILVRVTQNYDPQKLTTINNGCHLYVRGHRSRTFRHCCCSEGRTRTLPTWWIENLSLENLKKKLVYPKPNIPLYSRNYSPIYVDQNYKNIPFRFDKENWQNNRVRSIDGEDNKSYSNSGEEQNLSLVVTETNKASTESKKSNNAQFTTIVVQPVNPLLDDTSSQSSCSTTSERCLSSVNKPSLPMPSPPEVSTFEPFRLPRRLPKINTNNKAIIFDRDFPNFYRLSASFEKSQSFSESAVDQSNVLDEQSKPATATEDFSQENKRNDICSSQLEELQLEENYDLGIAPGPLQIKRTLDFDQDGSAKVIVRPPSTMLFQNEHTNENNQEVKVATEEELSKSDSLAKVAVRPANTELTENERKQDKVSTDQDRRGSTSCCAQLYELIMPCLKLCQN